MTRRETVRAKGTHQLETRGKDLSIYTKKQSTEGHFPSRYHKGRDLSEHVKNRPGEGHSPTGDHRRRDLSEHGK